MRTSSGAGWSSQAARRAHNPKVVGSNPTPATNFTEEFFTFPQANLISDSKYFPHSSFYYLSLLYAIAYGVG